MKALVKSHREKGLWLEEVARPELEINDVLIRVPITAIYSTDVHNYDWDAWAQTTIPIPLVIACSKSASRSPASPRFLPIRTPVRPSLYAESTATA
jgi:hypothetical protein